MWEAYPAIHGFVRGLCASLVARVAALGEAPSTSGLACYYAGGGVDAVGWLSGSVPVPPEAYLRSAPVSFPLVGLTQLASYAATLCALGLGPEAGAPGGGRGPGALLAASAGATGHSQGIVAAAAVAAAGDWQALAAAGADALALLLASGARMQAAAEGLPPARATYRPPRGAPPPQEDASDAPSDMLTVAGLTPRELEAHVAAANGAIASAEAAAAGGAPAPAPAPTPTPAPLAISLVNGASACVVSGRAAHLRFLVGRLEGARAAPGADQSRVPFSARRPVLAMRYLRVSAPFHSALLAPAVGAIAGDAAGLAHLSRGALRLPLYSTADGADLREAPADGASLAAQLGALQAVAPVDWAAATAATRAGGAPRMHVLDFGPGGTSGAGRLTARLLQGAGVDVILCAPGAGAPGGEGPPQASHAPRTSLDPAPEGLPMHSLERATTRDAALWAAGAAPLWRELFGPRLVQREGDGAVLLDTKLVSGALSPARGACALRGPPGARLG